jgi:flagellar biosynthesis chaperone FliJ
MTVLHTLSAVRRLREDIAARSLARARGACLQAEAGLATAQRQLIDWQAQARQQEAAWYADLCARVVAPQDIESVRARVVVLQEMTAARERDVSQARNRLNDAAQALQQARAHRGGATRAVKKTAHLVQADAVRQHFEQGRRDDEEQDEIAGVLRGLRPC